MATKKKTETKKLKTKKPASQKTTVKKATVAKASAKKKPAVKTAPRKAIHKTATKGSAKGARAPKKAAPKDVPEKMRDAAMKVLDDRQAEDIISVDVRGKSALADYVLLASGRTARQLAALADHLGKAFSELGVKKIAVEGLPQGDWVLIDAGDVIVHLFRPEVRRYYALDDLWSPSRRGG